MIPYGKQKKIEFLERKNKRFNIFSGVSEPSLGHLHVAMLLDITSYLGHEPFEFAKNSLPRKVEISCASKGDAVI